MSGSTNIIAIDFGEASGEIRETIRAQLNTVKLGTNVVPASAAYLLQLAGVSDAEIDRLIGNLTKNIMQTLAGLAVDA